MGIQWPFCQKLKNQVSLTLDDLWPHVCWSHMCDFTLRITVSRSHGNTHQCMWIQWHFFFKILNQRSMAPRWHSTPRLLRAHVWLYLRIIVSKFQENTSKCNVCGYSDLFFSKTWTKGHWPIDDLWPQVCWGHMCDSTQGYLYPSPMKIQSTWIQWPLCQKLKPKKVIDLSRLPLTPCLLRSHVWLYPRITVSRSNGNTSIYVDTVINFAKYHIHTYYTYCIHIHYLYTLYIYVQNE